MANAQRVPAVWFTPSVCATGAQRSSAATPGGVGMLLLESEMDRLAAFWVGHSIECHARGNVELATRSGGGIGTITNVVCPCGFIFDITDYGAW